MRHYIILISILLACLLSSSSTSPIDSQRRLMNRPTTNQLSRVTRSDYHIKGRPKDSKTFTVTPYPSLRKGEYLCGNKVCKLRPGEKTCDMCQYPI